MFHFVGQNVRDRTLHTKKIIIIDIRWNLSIVPRILILTNKTFSYSQYS